MKSVIYALFRNNKIVYIGKSTIRNLKRRISSHRSYGKIFDSYRILYENIKGVELYPVDAVLVLEGFLIWKIDPCYNKTKQNPWSILKRIRKKDLFSLINNNFLKFDDSLTVDFIILMIKFEYKDIREALKISYKKPRNYDKTFL